MRRILSLLAVTVIAIASFSQKTISDPNVQRRSVSGFHGVSTSGSIDLLLTQGQEESVAVSASDPKLVEQIITEVKDGILHIYLKKKEGSWKDWNWESKKIRAYVSIKRIDYLSTSGSGKISIEGKLNADNLKITLSGSGNVKGDVAVKDLTVGISGSADVSLSGTSEKSSFSISGSGNISSYDLATDYCNVSTSGSGTVKVTVNKELSANTSGSGNIYIKGDGMLRDYRSSGSGKFKRIS